MDQSKGQATGTSQPRRAGGRRHGIAAAPPVVHEVLRSSGSPLDAASRGYAETRLGHDFSEVRIHSDGLAARSATAVGALAYAVGPHVVFGPDHLRPGTRDGRKLLLHELAHVIQQRGAAMSTSAQLAVDAESSPLESAADLVARAALDGAVPGGIAQPHRRGTPILSRAPDTAATAVRESPADLIKRHTHWGFLNKDALGRELVDHIPGDVDFVVAVFRALGSTSRDDVALTIASHVGDDTIGSWAAQADGRRAIQLVLGELNSGYLGDDEKAQRDRIMGLVESDRPAAPRSGPRERVIETQAAAARALIQAHTNLLGLNLNEEALALDLVHRMPDWALAEAVFQALAPSDRDDVAQAFVEQLDDRALGTLAAGAPDVRAFLQRLVRELHLGWTTGAEARAQQRVMKALGGADDAGRGADAALEIEVITFLYGGSPRSPGGGLDLLGGLGGTRGHTALSVGADIYSFEVGWSCGRSRDEYLTANNWRDAIGQVLRVGPADARRIRGALNDLCGTGYYAVGGDICTDGAARALSNGLQHVQQGSWDPSAFATSLDAAGVVESQRFYPQTARPRPGR